MDNRWQLKTSCQPLAYIYILIRSYLTISKRNLKSKQTSFSQNQSGSFGDLAKFSSKKHVFIFLQRFPLSKLQLLSSSRIQRVLYFQEQWNIRVLILCVGLVHTEVCRYRIWQYCRVGNEWLLLKNREGCLEAVEGLSAAPHWRFFLLAWYWLSSTKSELWNKNYLRLMHVFEDIFFEKVLSGRKGPLPVNLSSSTFWLYQCQLTNCRLESVFQEDFLQVTLLTVSCSLQA